MAQLIINFGKTERGIFFRRGLDMGDRIEGAHKMSSLAHAILLSDTTHTRLARGGIELICPAGSRRASGKS
jgi:hypothetical protein